ncbi:MAG: hypothetical protein HC840_20645 [Leptolyngbyaceae cyanobacterium RM2_2_4]|nr:hypothetical protein [Leptolyngbyaceae cyanobacterium RM2_2_4]
MTHDPFAAKARPGYTLPVFACAAAIAPFDGFIRTAQSCRCLWIWWSHPK